MGTPESQYLRPLTADADTVKLLQEAGFLTIFDVCRHDEFSFVEKTSTLPAALSKQIHAHAKHRSQCILSLHRAYQARNEPLMRHIAKLGVAPSPATFSSAMQRSLGGAPDFADLFPERSEDGYAEAESIQSLFSPGRYLVELYKIAVGLHAQESPLNLNKRRPDIAALTLNEKNMTQEVSTLDILIDVLQQGIEATTGVSMAELERTYYPMTLPYHDNLVQTRGVLSSRSSSLQQIWAILSDYQAQAFSPIVYEAPEDPVANIATPLPPTREELRLAPATYQLLVGNPATAEQIQRDYHLPSADIANELRTVAVFTERTGLSFNELLDLTGQSKPVAPMGNDTSRFFRFGDPQAVPVTEYSQTYIATTGPIREPLLIVGDSLDFSLVGSTYEISYPWNGQTINSSFTIVDIFSEPVSDGGTRTMITIGNIPHDTCIVYFPYSANSDPWAPITFPPPAGTVQSGTYMEFAGAHWSSVEGPGPQGPKTPLVIFNSKKNAVRLADRAERLIRLQRQVGIAFHELDWLIKHANLAFSPLRADNFLLDQPVLAALAEFMRLRDAYSVSSDGFACFIGDINTYAPQYQTSLYEKLFTSPTDGNTLPLDVTLNFDPSVPSEDRALLCGGLGVSADELYVMAKLAFTDTAAVVMDPQKFAQLYRQAMIPKMLGISFDQARLLWRMLNPDRDIAALVAGAPSLEVLDVIRQSETVLQWLRDHQVPLEEAFAMVSEYYSESVTPELFNFTQNIYASLSTDRSATTYEPNQPLSDSLKQKLYRLNASTFKVKANVMGRLIGWLDQHFTSAPTATRQSAPYGLGSFWSDIDSLFQTQVATGLDEMQITPDIARYTHAMAQYALIAQWTNLTEQDLTLIVDRSACFMGTGGDVPSLAPVPTLEVLLYIVRLKEWQQRVVVSEAEAMTYFTVANTPGQTADVALTFLAYIQGWDEQTTRDMNTCLVQAQFYAGFPTSFAQVLQLEAWMQVGLQAKVGTQCVQGLYRMSLEQAQAEDTTLIQDVAQELVATLQN